MDYLVNMINWLVFDSGISGYEIRSRTNISTTTIHRLRKGHQPISHLSLLNALKLCKMAEEAMEETV